MHNKKIFPLIFCCMLTATHITSMDLSTSTEKHADSPLKRGRSPLRPDESRPRSTSAPAQQSKICGILLSSPEKALAKSLRFSPRNSADSSESELHSPRQQQVDKMVKVEIEITDGNYLNPWYTPLLKPYVSILKKDIPLFKATDIKQIKDEIWQITYKDANEKPQSIHTHKYEPSRGYSYWVKEGGEFCIELSPPSTVTDESDITPKSNRKKPATINHKNVGLGLLAAFIIAILYRDNRLPDFSYYILAFNALLKGFGTKA